MTADVVDAHVRRFFAGHAVSTRVWAHGPMAARTHFHVLAIAPGPRTQLWSYVSSGAGDGAGAERLPLEFVLCTPGSSDRAVELVTMAAWYHAAEGLGVGHTLPIGEPWLTGATCDHFLVSRPYPFGPELEDVAAHATRIVWLLPVTAAERAFKVRRGLEALERVFDERGIEYGDPRRACVVTGPSGPL